MKQEELDLFDMPDPVIEEMDEGDFEKFKLNEEKKMIKIKESHKGKTHRFCNHCAFEGWLNNPKQFLCPRCGMGMDSEPLGKKEDKDIQPKIQEDIITDM